MGSRAVSGRVLARDGALPEGQEKQRAVEAMFDRVAPGYDRMNRVISLGLDTRWRRRAVRALSLERGSRVLDVACGTGDLCDELSGSGHRPVGIDLSAGMLTAAHTDAPLVRGDVVRMPFPADAFDGIVCGFALRNFVSLPDAFAACAQVLRRGGRFVALDAAVPSNPVLRAGNALWFRGAVPVLGRLLSRDPEAYRYLPKSTEYLPDPQVLVGLLRAAGFVDVARTTLTGGSVQLLTGTRA
jgi:demethylmenaquinone methyltransferase/2-methoxy-6-polyprenyl-1,4-benzoquinol methylase